MYTNILILFMCTLQTYQGELTNCWTKKKKAVDEICLGIHKQECFGLLGVNGERMMESSRVCVCVCVCV